MNISLAILPAHASRVVDMFCGVHRYDDNALDGETRGEFSKRMLIRWLKQRTLDFEGEIAAGVAREAAQAEDLDIT